MNRVPCNKFGITLAGVLVFVVLAARVHAGALAYSVTDLANFGGNQSHVIFGINASGQLAGYLTAGSGSNHAVRWDGSTTTNLVGLGGSNSYGFAINDSGQIAGSSDLPDFDVFHAVRWIGTIPTDLGTLGGIKSIGHGINDAGQVAGEASTADGSVHAVRWTGTTAEDLGALDGAAGGSQGNAINNSGQVAGWSTIPGLDGGFHAVRWTGTTAEDLGTLGGTASLGHDINASGQVAGYSYLAGNSARRAVRWTGTTAENLGTLIGGTLSEAYSINASGDVIGMSDTTNDGINGGYDAFIYTGGAMYDLTTLLLPGSGVTSLTVGTGSNINDLGQIAAGGIIGGEYHILILTPVAVPEPSSALLLVSTGWMWLLQRRRRSGL